MIKIAIPERNCLHMPTIEADKDFKIIENQDEADFVICQSTVKRLDLIKKIVYIASEPPLSPHRLICYSKFDDFHLVVNHKEEDKDNQIPFTTDKSDHTFPHWADAYGMITRDDTSIKGRGVFYAGNRGFYIKQPDTFGINITPIRVVLGEYFIENFPGSQVIGKGWFGQENKVDDWRRDKLEKIKNENIDFVLALENTIYPGYISEKIWDGIMSDKVTLYLGAPNIEKFIPSGCFLDLRKWFNPETKEFDCEGLGNYLNNMTQEEYDSIINNAREFRETVKGKLLSNSIDLTKRILEYLKNGKA